MMRASGILMHISSMPSPYGIGTLGDSAKAFVDSLQKAGQRFWQVLPVGHTGLGNSPYSTFSAFAGNPYFIDLDALLRDGLISERDIGPAVGGADPERVDYPELYSRRFKILRKACENGWERDKEALEGFCGKNADWLYDYALFMAQKCRNGAAAKRARSEIPTDESEQDPLARVYIYAQYLFFKQWAALKSYANSKEVRIIGDIPIYVPLDSADVWAHPENFCLDERGSPKCVAGVPPDYFSRTGQLWGNPLYDWERMEQNDFLWWKKRIGHAGELFDAVRLDHFRGFESYWAIPFGSETAESGQWLPGPGMKLMKALRAEAPETRFIAEDLGIITDGVRALREKSGFPGMAVLQFAFDERGKSAYLPHNIERESVCYTGTHDNNTLRGFLSEMPEEDRRFMAEYLCCAPERLEENVLRAGMMSKASLFIAQMQDWLSLGAEARMNTPGVPEGNWTWRMRPGAFTDSLAAKIRRMTEIYERAPSYIHA